MAKDRLQKKVVTDIEQADELGILINNVKEYPIFMINPTGLIRTWNAGARRTTGYEPNEVIGKHISIFFTTEAIWLGTMQQNLQYAQQKGSSEYESWWIRKDKSRFWANVVVATVHNAEGQFIGYAKVLRDITDTKVAFQNPSKLAKQKREGPTEFFHRITDAFVSFDQNWNYTYINKKASEQLGLTPDQLLGKNLWKTFPEFRFSHFHEIFLNTMKNQETLRIEDYYPPLGLSLRVTLYPSEHGLSMLLEDISAKKKIVATYYETLEKYRQIVETANEGIWMINEVHKTVFVNQKLCEILMYTADEMMDKDFFAFLAEEEKERAAGLLDQQTTGYREKVDLKYIAKNGKEIWANVATNPLFNPEGKYIGLFAMVSDITEKVELQDQLLNEQRNHQMAITKAVLEAEEKERAEIGAELHDNINQIITAATLYLEYSLSASDYKPSVIKAKEYLSSAIDEIRKLSKILVGPVKDEKMGLVATILELLEDITLVKDIDFVFNYTGFRERPIETGLKTVIYRVVQEQLNNIIKHAKASHVEIELKDVEGGLYLSINDNGVGFTTSGARQGIGLKNIRNRVETYGGTVKIVSSPGNGCKVEIRFSFKF